MSAQAQVPSDHPLMIAWEKYKAAEDYENTRNWAKSDRHVDGSLWAAFSAGWLAAHPADSQPKPAEGGAVGDAKSTVDDIMFGWRLGQQRVTKGDAENLAARYARKKCHTFATAGSGEAVALLREAYEWLFESKSDGPRVSEGAIVKGFYSEEFRGFHDRLLTAIASIETPSPYAVPVESLGRDARGVDAVRLAKIGYEAAAQVTGCDQSWEHANKPKWIACAEAIARRLTASDARPVIDEAMVERALTEWFYDLSWADVQKEYEDGGDKLRNYMRAALTAALTEAGHE